MSRMCGFKFYKLKKGKLYSVKAACVFRGKETSWESNLIIYGFSQVTDIFLEAFNDISLSLPIEELKPENKYFSNFIFNHPELDGYELHYEKEDPESNYYGEWFKKFFYIDLDKFKDNIFNKYNSIKDEEKTTLSQRHLALLKRYFNYIYELIKIDPKLIVTAFAL